MREEDRTLETSFYCLGTQPDMDGPFLREQSELVFDSTKPQGEFKFEEAFNSFLDGHPKAKEKIFNFMTKVWGNYEFLERNQIDKALQIATVAHQYNWKEGKRFRKKIDPETGERIPYIFHSLEVAEKLVDEGFDWLTVSAALLHDVPEDVYLGEGFDSAEAWLNFLEKEFENTGQGQLLTEILRGLTKRALLEDGETRREEEKQTPMYKMIKGFIERGGIKGRRKKAIKPLTEEEEGAIVGVVRDLEHTFNSALQSPEHWRIFVIKIADIWNNLQDKWVKPEKILRGRIAASLAEWMGWYEARSEIIEMMAEITDTTSPYAPDLAGKYTPFSNDKDLTSVREASEKIWPWREKFSFPFSESARPMVGWPVIHSDHGFPGWKGTTLPVPEVVVTVERDLLERFDSQAVFGDGRRAIFTGKVISTATQKGDSWARAKYLHLLTPTIVNMFGRLRRDYSLKIGNAPAFILRLQSDEPCLIDLFKRDRGGPIDVGKVPEAGLFNNHLQRTDFWDFHLASLIGFCYEPSAAVTLGRRVFAIFHQGKIYFFDGDLTFRQVFRVLGLTAEKGKLSVRSFEGREYGVQMKTRLKNFKPYRSTGFRHRIVLL